MAKDKFYSLDVTSPYNPPFNLKKILKKVAIFLRLYREPHGENISKSFFSVLYIEPSSFEEVEIELVSSSDNSGIIGLYINNQYAMVHFLENVARVKTRSFFAYENIISLKKDLPVDGVKLTPVIDKNRLDQQAVLTQRYQLVDDINGHKEEYSFRLKEKVNSDDAILSCIFQARITDTNSPFHGLYYPAFDNNTKTYRLSSWTWTNGILVKLFLDAGGGSDKKQLSSLGLSLADRLLDFQQVSGAECGAMMARWDILNQTPSGIAPQLATNDSAFLASNAFLSAYTYSKDEKYLIAALQVGEWILNRGMKPDGQLYVGMRQDTEQWVKNHIFVDAGFTSSLFAGLYSLTSDVKWKDATVRFENWFIHKLYDEQNHYFWWNWYDFRRPGTTMFARGQAWAMDGLIASYNITRDEKYLAVLSQLSSTMIRAQSKSGGWYYHLNKPSTGFDAKGTPIIAYHLARIWQLTKNEELKASAEKALNWCDAAIIKDKDDIRVYGGIAAISEEGTMYGARNISSIFMYAQAYYKLCQQVLKGSVYEY